MAAATTHLHQFILPASAAGERRSGPGLLKRFFTMLEEARMRQAEREIALLIERRGGRLTDDLEREIQRSFI